ncbi:MAG: hypothetical protein WCT01_05150, partial [Candidatus Shapirobacteria bacterium]
MNFNWCKYLTSKIVILRWQLNLFGLVAIYLGALAGIVLISSGLFLKPGRALDNPQVVIDSASAFNLGTTASVSFTGVGDSAVVKLSGNDTPPLWWNSAYGYRQQLTVTNLSGSSLPSGYSFSYNINHASLVSLSQSLSSGDDIRIVYWNGSSNVELDRVLDDASSWNSASTQIWFRGQSTLGALSASTDYYVYYGNSGATSPPVNKSNIYALWDDFNQHENNTDPDGWREDSGTWYVQDHYYYTSGGNQPVTSSTVFGNTNTDYIFEAKTKFASGSYVGLMPRHTGLGVTDNGYYLGPNGSGNSVEFWKRVAGNWTQQGTGVGFTGFTDNNWHTQKAIMVGSSMAFYFDGLLIKSYTDTSSPWLAGAAALHTTAAGYYDDIKVRLYTPLEPTVESGAQVVNMASSGSWLSSSAPGSVIDLVWNGGWGNGLDAGSTAFVATVANVGVGNTITFKIKTAATASALSNADFINLGSISTGTLFSKTKAEMDALGVSVGVNRFVQIQTSFSQVNGVSPILDKIELYHLQDTLEPSGVSQVSIGATINGWVGTPPQVSWHQATDTGSSVYGYCLSLDQSDIGASAPDNDPVNSSGVLGIGQTYSECPFVVTTPSFDLTGVSLTSNKQYYLSIKSVDIAGNISTSAFQNLTSFKYDVTPPTNPSALSAPQTYQSNIDSITI